MMSPKSASRSVARAESVLPSLSSPVQQSAVVTPQQHCKTGDADLAKRASRSHDISCFKMVSLYLFYFLFLELLGGGVFIFILAELHSGRQELRAMLPPPAAPHFDGSGSPASASSYVSHLCDKQHTP